MSTRVPVLDLDEYADALERAAKAARRASEIQRRWPSQKTREEQQRVTGEFLTALKGFIALSDDLERRASDLKLFGKALEAGSVKFI